MNANIWVLALQGAVGFGAVLTLAALGALINERAGVINLGTEGMMLVGAVAAFLGARGTHSPWLGLACGAVAGAALAVPHALLAVTMRAEQIVSGLTLVIFGTGVANYLGEPVAGDKVAAKLRAWHVPGLSRLSVIGPVLFTHEPLVWGSWVLVGLVGFVLFRTRAGLALRAVGEEPAAADVAGLSVPRIRYAAVLLGGALAGLAGGELMLARIPSWSEGATTGGIGFVALALVVFAGWRPGWIVAGAVLFGFAQRASYTLQVRPVSWLPSLLQQASILAMLPYVATIAVLFGRAAVGRRRGGAPAALGRPYVRDER